MLIKMIFGSFIRRERNKMAHIIRLTNKKWIIQEVVSFVVDGFEMNKWKHLFDSVAQLCDFDVCYVRNHVRLQY